MFSAEEFRRFVAELPLVDNEARAQLPGRSASLDDLLDTMLEVLERRNLLGIEFFMHLAAVRPNHAVEIDALVRERDLQAPEAFEVARLLSDHCDAAVERRLTELERSLATTRKDRSELNLAVADLSRWHQEAQAVPEQSAGRRDAIVRRLTALAADLVRRGPRGSAESARVALHPDALNLQEAIESYVRRADGERAVLRLLDLAERFAPDKGSHRAAIMLSAQVQTWLTGRRPNSRFEPEERHEWVALLAQILELTDQFVQWSATPPSDATGGSFRGSAQTTHAGPAAGDHESARGALLRGESLSKRYGPGGRFALKDVSLSVFPRTIVGIVGPNGAGKSTLLRILCGELRASGGSLSYPQLSPAAKRQDRVDWATVRSRIGYLPQRLPTWRGRLIDNLHAWAAACGIVGRDNADIVEFYLERLGLGRYREARWGEISGGYQTRFALAKALVGRPRLLLLDEPLAALDVRAQQRFLQDLRDIASSSSLAPGIILSSQHIPELESVADELIGLRDDGGVWFCGSTHELERTRTESVYELGGHLSESTRDRLTAHFGPGAVQQHESLTLLRVSRVVPRFQILDILRTDQDPPKHIRDISGSLLKMFWQDDS